MSHSTGAERAPLGNLKPGKISPRRPVPAHIDRPEYMYHSGPEVITASDIKTPETIEKIRNCLSSTISKNLGMFNSDIIVPS